MQVGVQVTFTIIMSILFHRMLTLYLGGPYIRGPHKRDALYVLHQGSMSTCTVYTRLLFMRASFYTFVFDIFVLSVLIGFSHSVPETAIKHRWRIGHDSPFYNFAQLIADGDRVGCEDQSDRLFYRRPPESRPRSFV